MDEPLKRKSPGFQGFSYAPEWTRTTTMFTHDKALNPVDELRLSERLLEPPVLGAYACIAPSRLLHAPGHARTLPEG
jgi:hypothetical protein